MSPSTLVEEHSAALLTSAHGFQLAAEQAGSSEAAATSLSSLEEALRLIGQGWQLLGADAARPGAGESLTPEERRLVTVLQDVGAAFTRCARICRDGEYAIARLAEASDYGEAEHKPRAVRS